MTRIGHQKNSTPRRKVGFQPCCEGTSMAQIVEAFEKEWLPFLIAELKYYARLSSLDEAVRAATDKGHSHLNRISPEALDIVRARLLGSAKLRAELVSFDQLYTVVEEEIGGIYGIGLLTTYDIAQRIGAYLKLRPQKVYLHAGAKRGAQILKVGRGKRKVERQAFHPDLQRLQPQFIEDFLCICQQDLVRLKASNPADQADS